MFVIYSLFSEDTSKSREYLFRECFLLLVILVDLSNNSSWGCRYICLQLHEGRKHDLSFSIKFTDIMRDLLNLLVIKLIRYSLHHELKVLHWNSSTSLCFFLKLWLILRLACTNTTTYLLPQLIFWITIYLAGILLLLLSNHSDSSDSRLLTYLHTILLAFKPTTAVRCSATARSQFTYWS